MSEVSVRQVDFDPDACACRPGDGARKFVLYPSASSRPIEIIKPSGPDAAQHSVPFHAFCGSVSNLGVYLVPRAQLRGRGFVFTDGRLLDAPDLVPQYVLDHISQGKRDDISAAGKAERSIAGFSLLLPSEGYPFYGHWILDILPRAWLFMQRFLRRLPEAKQQKALQRLNLIVPYDAPDYGLNLLRSFFEVDGLNIVRHRWLEENLLLETAIIPSSVHNSHIFHPAADEFVSYCIGLAASARIAPPEKIYVTRQNFDSRSYGRSLSNEPELIEILQLRGFRVISPQGYDWMQQIALFSHASIVVGESGSGLHNALFSPQGSRVVCLRPNNHVQATIAGLRRQKIAFLNPATEVEAEGAVKFTISPETLVSVLDHIGG